MKKFFTKTFFCGLMIALAGLHVCYATNYYVDATGGSDANNGQSQASAWKTIHKVNLSPFLPGDFILFKRGETFRGNINFDHRWPAENPNPTSGSSAGYLTFGAYGTGNRPLLLASINRKLTSDWVSVGTNLWRTSNVVTIEGFAKDAGNLIFNNEASVGWKVASLGEVNSQGRFYSDLAQRTVTLYSVGNPGLVYSNIEIVLNKSNIAVWSKGYFIFENLDLRYSGLLGVDFGYVNNCIVRDCNISFIGGSWWSGTTRLGNGVQIWQGGNNCTVERCTISQIFDAGISPQGTDGGYQAFNFYFRNNIIDKCEQSYEIWTHGVSTMHDIYFENNTCLNAGSGWGHAQRGSQEGKRGSHLTHFGWNSGATLYNIFVRNNIFSNASQAGILAMGWSDISTSKITINNNDWNVTNQFGIHQWDANGYSTPIYSNWSTYRSTSGQDANSINTNPMLNTDNTLQAGSPCINTGITTANVTTDFIGTTRPQGSAYDIGAYEYTGSVPPPTPGNLALNKPVTVSSTQPPAQPGDPNYPSSYQGSYAVDGNSTTTRWSSTFSDPQWIYVDLGAAYNVNRVKITWEAAYASAYQIQISSDASTWTTMKTITGNTTLVNDHTTGIAGTGRYIRMLGTTRATVYGYSIYELEVYGTASNTPVASSNSPVCAGSTINLSTPAVTGATYSWTGPNGFTSALRNPSIANAVTTMSGTYSVTITVSGNTSSPGTTTVVVNPKPATPVASSNSPVTIGATINLSTSAVPGATYSWTGPNGFTSAAQNPAIANATAAMAGTYSVVITTNGCASAAGTTSVVVNATSSNLALNKPVTVSSTQPPAQPGDPNYPSSYQGSFAVDGNAATRWSSTFSDPQWIYVDLGATYNVNRVKITWEAAYATAYQIQISSDASTWTTMKTITGNTTLVNDHTTGIAGTGRYIRIYGTTRATVYGYSIYELEVYGVAGQPADTQAPTIPTGLASSNVTSNSFTISWTASTDNVGVTGYDVYKAGILYGSSASTSLNITGLAANTTYAMTVKAKDAAGNVSAASNALNVVTSSSNNLLLNPGFESGTASWIAGACTITSSTNAHGGASSIFTSGRTANWAGPRQGIASILNAHGQGNYYVEGWMKMASGTANGRVIIQITANGVTSYFGQAAAVNATNFTKISGTVNLTWTGTVTYAMFILDTEAGTTNFYADDCVLSSAGQAARFANQPQQQQETANQEPKFSVFPNPVANILTVNAESSSDILIFDTHGRIVNKVKAVKAQTKIDMSSFSSGLYFIKVQSLNRSYIKKVIKQ